MIEPHCREHAGIRRVLEFDVEPGCLLDRAANVELSPFEIGRKDQPLRAALDRGQLSIRGMDRTLRVAWTLADLAGRTSPGLEQVGTALSFRQGRGAL